MKKILVVSFLLMFSTSAFAGVLMGQWTEGLNRYCKYSDGKIITVNFGSICPATN